MKKNVSKSIGFLYENYQQQAYTNTVFRQAFLLIQYSFICKQYYFCSNREYQYIFNKTADCFNNIVLAVKISRKNLLKKWKRTQRWKRSYEC